MTRTRSKPPWEQPSPRSTRSTKLSPRAKQQAAARARVAGRRYPNLVDNMNAAAESHGDRRLPVTRGPRTSRRRRTGRRRASGGRRGGRPTRASLKDPRGGLTAAGRRAFARREGAHLRPGVKKPVARMSPQEMRRKGSWAIRFYGRPRLPALVDPKGRPTRFALSAAAWGEPVPRTQAAARRIAAKGRRLLARYHRRAG
jgi:hypothetical protein